MISRNKFIKADYKCQLYQWEYGVASTTEQVKIVRTNMAMLCEHKTYESKQSCLRS